MICKSGKDLLADSVFQKFLSRLDISMQVQTVVATILNEIESVSDSFYRRIKLLSC